MRSVQNATFELWEKKLYRVPSEFLQKNQNIFQGYSKDTLWKDMDFVPMKTNKNQSILQQLRC